MKGYKGHINIKSIQATERASAAQGLRIIGSEDFFCEPCVFDKQPRKPHKSISEDKKCKPGEMIHTDVYGHIIIESPKGSRYFILFKDENSGFRKVCFMRHKSEAFEVFKKLEAAITRQTGNQIKVLRSDNGNEYLSNQFSMFLEDKGITH